MDKVLVLRVLWAASVIAFAVSAIGWAWVSFFSGHEATAKVMANHGWYVAAMTSWALMIALHFLGRAIFGKLWS